MPSLGSWIRFILGILLAIEVLWQSIAGNMLSIYSSILAVAILVMSAVYFIVRF